MRKLSGFDPIILIKVIFILFIAIGLGLLYLLYRTHVTSIGAWVTAAIITLFMACLYAAFFTDLQLSSGNQQPPARLDDIIYDHLTFQIISPILQQKTEVKWTDIETILYDNQPYNDYDSYGERYTIIMKTPAMISVDADARWYNRIFKSSQNQLKLYIDNERNAGLSSLKHAIDKNLGVKTLYEDFRRGSLIAETDYHKGIKRVVRKHWKPKQMEYPLQLIYDIYHRDIREVLLIHGMLNE